MIPGIVTIVRRIAFSVAGGIKRQDRNRSLLTIAISKAEVLDDGFIRTGGTGVNAAAGLLFGRRVGIVHIIADCTGT